jgi:hypothetical protein
MTSINLQSPEVSEAIHQRLSQYDAIKNSEGQDPSDLVNYVVLLFENELPTRDYLTNDLSEFLGDDDARDFVNW